MFNFDAESLKYSTSMYNDLKTIVEVVQANVVSRHSCKSVRYWLALMHMFFRNYHGVRLLGAFAVNRANTVLL